jgi:hypothetical protein
MFSIISQLLGSIPNQRTRYLALVALAALIVCAALLGADQTDD